MKKILISVFLISTLMTSCFKDQMDISPTDLITPEKVFSSEDGAEAALVGVYSRFSPGWYYFDVIKLEAYGNKDWYPGANQGPLLAIYETHKITPSERVGYKRLWSTITFANAYIDNVNKYNTQFSDASRREESIAEARTLRAFVYFEMVQLWGPVPLITDEIDFGILYPSNSTIGDLYQQIIKDLEFGIAHLPTVGSIEAGRVTKGTAQAILAKVMMCQKDENQNKPAAKEELLRAVSLMSDVMTQYSLMPVYDNLWDRAQFNNSENIFCAATSNLGTGNGIHFPQYASHDYEPSQAFFDSFEEEVTVGGNTYTDVRRESTIFVQQVVPSAPKTLRDNKYRRAGSAPGTPNTTTANLYIIRLSDIILLKAEALNKLGYDTHKDEIFSLLNMVRNRAGAVPATESNYSDQASMALAIEEERHKELFFEFQSFFDLKRNGRLIEVLGSNGAGLGLDNDYQRRLPFSESEINKNHNLKQNLGY